MKKLILPIIAVLVLFFIAGCATFATNQDVPQKTIPVIGFVSPKLLPAGTEIASFTKVFGFCLRYDEFVEAVDGFDYDVYEKTFFVFSKVIAIAK